MATRRSARNSVKIGDAPSGSGEAEVVGLPTSPHSGPTHSITPEPSSSKRPRATCPSNDTKDGILPRVPASRVVYNTLELRRKIFEQIDRDTLAGMMRLEKGCGQSVAEVLYRSIHHSTVASISRTSSRRETYCTSVIEIDRSPPPDSDAEDDISPPEQAAAVNPKALLDGLHSLRLAFPRLRKVLYEYPANMDDEGYIVHMAAERITIDLLIPITVNVCSQPFLGDKILPPPPPPTPGMLVRQMLMLRCEHSASHLTSAAKKAQRIEQWRDWLFENPDLDRRIAGLTMSRSLQRKAKVTDDDVISFLANHAARGCRSLREFSLLLSTERSRERRDMILHFIGPRLRSLQIQSAEIEADWAGAIASLDRAFPYLRKLVLGHTSKLSIVPDLARPLVGLHNLRSFRGSWTYDASSVPEPFGLARYVHGLGSRDCSFIMHGYREPHVMEEFHTLVGRLKSFRPGNAILHTLDNNDLDLWHPDHLLTLTLPTTATGENVRRLGWTKSTEHALDFAARRVRLDDMLVDQQGAIDGFELVLAGLEGELAETAGDTKSQGEILRRRFEVAEQRKKELGSAFKMMRGIMSEMERASKDVADYARQWLEHQEGAQGG